MFKKLALPLNIDSEFILLTLAVCILLNLIAIVALLVLFEVFTIQEVLKKVLFSALLLMFSSALTVILAYWRRRVEHGLP